MDKLAQRNIEIIVSMASKGKPIERIKAREKIDRYIKMTTDDIKEQADYKEFAKACIDKTWKKE